VPAFEGLSLSEKEREFRLNESIWESSWRQTHVGNNVYERVPVSIDPELIEKWERTLAEGTAGDRDLLDVGTRSGTPEIAELETKVKAFDTRRIWRTPSAA
jgi:hypothetical protein